MKDSQNLVDIEKPMTDTKSELRSWCIEVKWDDGPYIFGDPDKLFPGLIKFDHEALAATRGKQELILEAQTIGEAMKMACDWAEEQGHKPWDCWVID